MPEFLSQTNLARVSREVKGLREMSPLYEMAREGIDLKSVNWRA